MQIDLGSRRSTGSGTGSSTGLPARALLRINGYATMALGAAIVFLAGSLGRALGLHGAALPAIGGIVILVLGLDELGFALGRRMRSTTILPFAAVDALACVVALIVVAASGPALSIAGRTIIVLGAAALGWFAYADVRSTHSL